MTFFSNRSCNGGFTGARWSRQPQNPLWTSTLVTVFDPANNILLDCDSSLWVALR